MNNLYLLMFYRVAMNTNIFLYDIRNGLNYKEHVYA